MHLEEMKKEIESLVLEKGFYNNREDIPKKLLFAFIELGEASDAWKKGAAEEKIAEELIDVIFYLLDASRLACPSVNMDEAFATPSRYHGSARGLRMGSSAPSRSMVSSRTKLPRARDMLPWATTSTSRPPSAR